MPNMNQLVNPENSNLVLKDDANNEFVCTKLAVEECVSGISRIEAHVLTTVSSPNDWIGTKVDCEVYDSVGAGRSANRVFQGYVISSKSLTQQMDSTYSSMVLIIKPWIALLAYSKQYRVFQEESVQNIVTSIFDELGFKGQYTIKSMPSTKREYCIQFNETDLEFVLRLLAEEGVHFYYGKGAQASKLFLQDASKPFAQDGLTTLDHFIGRTGDYEIVTSWESQRNYHSASLDIANFDYNQSKLISSKPKLLKNTISGNTKLKQYRYPSASGTGKYTDLASSLVTIQKAQMESEYYRTYGETSSLSLAVGHYLKMNANPEKSDEGSFLVSEITALFEMTDDNKFERKTAFVCVPEDQVFYPTEIEKPVLHGLQTAVVSGKKDDEPACDNAGRVKIKFHWDSETGDKTSCWVRVAQAMAGTGYGFQFLPRAGHEVLVSFINGDPDQPVVVSSVYNSTHKPPYATANTTQTGFKTKLKGESNELRFDDKKDSESFYMHAAKDFLHEVVNDHTETVDGEKKTTVLKSITDKTDVNYSLTAKENITLKSDKKYSLKATDSISDESKTITLKATDKLTLVVGGSEIVMTDSKIDISSKTVNISGSSSLSLKGGSFSLKANPISFKSDGNMSFTAGVNLSMKAGNALTAKGLNATLQGDVKATVKGSAMAELSASGQTTVKGAIVMVN